MSVIIPEFGVMPNPNTQTQVQYDAAWEGFHGVLGPYGLALTALGAEVEANAANAESAVEALANAVWVSGTSYTAGQVRYSPVDFYSYRRKTNGAGTTDPSQDPVNWALLTKTSAGGAETTSSAVDIALTSASSRLQIISMSAAGKKATLPSSTTLDEGGALFVLHNAGQYRYSVHKYGGNFLCWINPGQVVAFFCSDNSSAAGVWQVSGQDVERIYGGNNAEVLNAVDSRNIAVAMASATQAVCAFRNNVTGYLNAVVLNYGTAFGSPAQVTAMSAKDISIAAQTASQVTILFRKDTGETQAVVLDITSTTTFTAGAVKQLSASTTGSGTAVCALSSTQVLGIYQPLSSDQPKGRVIDIVSSAINEGAEANASGPVGGGNMVLRKISATKCLLGFSTGMMQLVSISGSTVSAAGSVLNLSTTYPYPWVTARFGVVVLSASRALVVSAADATYTDVIVGLIDISGSTSSLVTAKKLTSVNGFSTLNIYACKLDANTAYATWTGSGSLGVDAIIITATADDRIIVSPVTEKLAAGVTSTAAYLACDALDSGHVMHVYRNSLTYLGAETIVIGG